VHDRICAICCGTEREVTLDCPSDCVYLQQARQHEKPRNMEEVDRAAFFPQVQVSSDFLYQREPLIVGLSYGLAKTARADRSIRDRDIIAALTDLATTYERMVNSGLVYEPAAPNVMQQALMAEVRKLVQEYRDLEHRHLGFSSLRDSEVLQALIFLLRTAQARTSGRPRSRAFLDFLFTQFPEKKESAIATPAEGPSRILLP
jgi:hypothetical protein